MVGVANKQPFKNVFTLKKAFPTLLIGLIEVRLMLGKHLSAST
jgi:hypothetical protein